MQLLLLTLNSYQAPFISDATKSGVNGTISGEFLDAYPINGNEVIILDTPGNENSTNPINLITTVNKPPIQPFYTSSLNRYVKSP